MSTTNAEHGRLKMANHDHVENGHNEQMEKEGSHMMAMDPHMMHHMHAKRLEQQVSQLKEQKRSFMDLVTAPSFVKRFMMNRYAIKTSKKGQDRPGLVFENTDSFLSLLELGNVGVL
jgi:hypothetical protein